jgi:maleate isomerase
MSSLMTVSQRLTKLEPNGVDYGDLSRIGIIIPSPNIVAESEIRAMSPPGVGTHFTRLPLRGSSAEALAQMRVGVDEAAQLLADAGVDQIVFHCTAVTTFDAEVGQVISDRIKMRTGINSFSTSEAIIAALRVFRAQDIAMITPYVETIHERERAFLAANGIRAVVDSRMDIGDVNDFGRITPAQIMDDVIAHADPRASAYFISCTAVRSAGLIKLLEEALRRPVITSNQAMMWYALQRAAVSCPMPQFGQIFGLPLSSTS